VDTITNLGELRRLTHAPFSQSLVHKAAPELKLPAASATELARWQERLNRDLYACGCTAGAIALVGSLAVLAIAEFAAGIELGSGEWAVGVWVFVALGAAVLGKAGGLLAARLRRRQLYAEIEWTLTGRTSSAPPSGSVRDQSSSRKATRGFKELKCADFVSD